MSTVTIEVSDIETTKQRAKAAFRGEPQGCFITFFSDEALWSIVTPDRWAILKAMTGAGPLGVGELSRLLGRDLEGVDNDTHALVLAGIVDQTDDGRLLFPYDEVRLQLVLKAA